jgi:L-ascorbate metabolism protein UlaG (beta-lactamase superfamily)
MSTIDMSVRYDNIEFDRPGHATVRIKTDVGTVIYIDPWSEVVDGQPRDADIVFITHNDMDHYDEAAIDTVAKPDATVAVYEAVNTDGLNFDIVELPLEGETTVAGVLVESIPGYNDPGGDHVNDEGEPFHAEGEVVGLRLVVTGTSILYPSDTDFLPHHEGIAADVLIPPIGGEFTMNRRQAAALVRAIEPALVLPVHYNTFEPIETDVEAFVEELSGDGFRVEAI